MKKSIILISLVVVCLLTACEKPPVPPFGGGGTNNPQDTVEIIESACDQDVIISQEEYETAPDDPFYGFEYEIVGNCLKIKFQASGCDGSTWNVKLIDVGVVVETLPCQRYLRLSLDNQEDCKALPVKEISFNIKDLQIYGDRQVLLNIAGKKILYEY
jgi:hypothetical protein